MITKLLQRYLRTLHKILKAFVFEPLSSLQQGKLFPDDLEATADWPIQDQSLSSRRSWTSKTARGHKNRELFGKAARTVIPAE
ncbi:hypothetical protein CK222_31015 [Mesorhizobium sp. WSM3866]|nr:hypothetical protein CK222_31015 [Mesorhizobium sp. WSM3866]